MKPFLHKLLWKWCFITATATLTETLAINQNRSNLREIIWLRYGVLEVAQRKLCTYLWEMGHGGSVQLLCGLSRVACLLLRQD